MAMITELSMKNFKSWRDTGPMRFAPITAFFGANSSGKTSILQLLLMLKQTVESPDRRQALELWGDQHSLVDLGGYDEVVFGNDGSSSISWLLHWNLPDEAEFCIENPDHPGETLVRSNEISFHATIGRSTAGKNGQGHPRVESMHYDAGELRFGIRRENDAEYVLIQPDSSAFALTLRRGRPPQVEHQAKCYAFPDAVRAKYQNADFLSDFEVQFQELFARVHYLGPLREYPRRHYVWDGSPPRDMGKRGEWTIRALLASSGADGNPAVEETVSNKLKEVGLIHSFEIRQSADIGNHYAVWVRRQPNSPEVLLPDIGFGVSQILPVLTLCYYAPKGSILILEQPEIHLHPSVQAALADVFVDAIKHRGVQIILESHSEHLLRRLQRRVAEEKLSEEEVTLYFCEMRDGQSELSHLELDAYGNIRNWPEDFFGDQFGEVAAMSEAGLRRKVRDSA